MFVSVLLVGLSCGLCRCRAGLVWSVLLAGLSCGLCRWPVSRVVCAVAGRSLVWSVPLLAGLSCGADHTVVDGKSEQINWRCLAARPRAGNRAALKR